MSTVMIRRPPLHSANERSQLQPFVVSLEAIRPRDQRDLMERPFFSLAKVKRIAPIRYRSGTVEVQVHAMPEHGMATIWDADVLIWAASQIVEAEDTGLRTSRFLRFTPYQLLTAIGRGTGQRQYLLLKGTMQRLQSTVVATNIRHGEHWRRQQFSWITEWEERVDARGRSDGYEFVLPDWFYRGVIDRSLVLSIDPAYFRLTGGIERWLYRVARKHAGKQPAGWIFDLHHLHAKSGSQARFSDFAGHLRRIVARQSLPGYALALGQNEHRALLQVRPRRSDHQAVDGAVNGHGTSNASGIGTSDAALSVLRTQNVQLTLWPDVENPTRNLDSNPESNLKMVRLPCGNPSASKGIPS
jgi:plasmid replication initiation protein